MAIDFRPNYAQDETFSFDDLNRWSINGSPQWISDTLITAQTTQLFQDVFDQYPDTAYSNFKIVFHRMTHSAGTATLQLKLAQNASIPVVAGFSARERVTYAGVAVNSLGYAGTNNFFNLVRLDANNGTSGILDIFNPYKPEKTQLSGMFASGVTSDGFNLTSGRNNNNNLYDGFQLSLSVAGTMTGRVSVYAFRDGSV